MEDLDGQLVQKVNAKGFLDTLKALQTFEHVPDEVH